MCVGGLMGTSSRTAHAARTRSSTVRARARVLGSWFWEYSDSDSNFYDRARFVFLFMDDCSNSDSWCLLANLYWLVTDHSMAIKSNEFEFISLQCH